jgi:glycosyltransferase involved in cell wall biosynthesis
VSLSNDGPVLTVVSRSFPPQVSGSAIVMANLLSGYTGAVAAIAGYSRYAESDSSFGPPCPTKYLLQQRVLPRLYEAFLLRWPAVMSCTLRNSIGRALVRLGTQAVLAVFPSDDFLVATFAVARKLDLPFYVHMHDLWIENKPLGTEERYFAEKWEPVILQESNGIFCITEAMQKHYETKYNIHTHLMPHSIPEEDFLNTPGEICPPQLPKPTVLFVGSVSSEMNVDALRVLARASELLPEDYELLFCTNSDLSNLNRLDIRSTRLRVKYVSRAEVQRLQKSAHVLIAPLSHKDCSMDEVRTVFSTKLLEYFISGRPILVYAPKDSYHAQSAREKGWAYVVTEDSPGALAAGIQKVLTDQNLAASLVHGALREAQRRNAKHHAAQLWKKLYADNEQLQWKAGTTL